MMAFGNTRTGGLPDSLCDSAYTVVTGTALRGAQMHIIIAQMSHETNTYSPVISDLARFSPGGNGTPITGDAAREM